MSFYLFLIFLCLLIQCGTSQNIVNVTEENELEQFLCYNDPPVVGNTLVVLYANITHYISGNVSFCMINTTYSLNITSNSSGPATINCNQTGNHSYWPTTGFSFINVHNLTLQRLVFRGCGGFLNKSTNINSTVSPFHFTQYQSAVLLFPHINILLIEDVTITFYYGFAILAINPVNATMNGLTISVTLGQVVPVSKHTYTGSGTLIVFACDYITGSHNVTINNSLITLNIEDSRSQQFLKYSRYVQNYYSILSSAGLTVLYAQTNYSATVSIFKTNFTINYGIILFFLHYKTNHGRVVFDQVSFERNIANMKSALILLLMIDVSNVSYPLHLDHSMFRNNVLNQPESGHSSLVFIGLYNPLFKSTVNITFSNSVFTKTNVTTAGSCIHATDTGTQGGVLNIYLNNITAYDNFKTNNSYGNTETELIIIVNAKALYISGYNNFSYNFGSIFDITNTIIYLNGQLNITGNNGYMGTGFKLQGQSYFLLSNGLNATFINNTALTIGGAIYAIADDDFNKCMFQSNTNNVTDIKMTFIGNTASEAGSSIYTSKLFYTTYFIVLV
uniref:Right handed beta helix domain-containing protein n=1 Tax=Amphimedon queenslandica TaxID=400682 RepID=A0A1X7T4L6_AMPQE